MVRLKDIFTYNMFVTEKKSDTPKRIMWEEYKKISDNPVDISTFTKVIKETNKQILEELLMNPDGIFLIPQFLRLRLILQEVPKEKLKILKFRKYMIEYKYYPMIELVGSYRGNFFLKFWEFKLQTRTLKYLTERLKKINYNNFKTVSK